MKGTREVTFVKMYMIEDHAQCLNSHISHTVTGFLMYIKAIFKIALQKIHCMHKLFLNGYFLINFNVLEKKTKVYYDCNNTTNITVTNILYLFVACSG